MFDNSISGFEESKIYRKQKILFVLIDILFTFNLVTSIAVPHYYQLNPTLNSFLPFAYPFIWILLSIIYDIFGLFVTYQCHRIGLRVFMWIGILFLIVNCFIFGLVLFLPIHLKTATTSTSNTSTSRYVIVILFWISISVLLVISVRLAFQLSESINHIRNLVKNQC